MIAWTTAGALLAGPAALGWLADRLADPNAIAATADALAAHGRWAVVALWLAALTLLVRRRWTVPADGRTLSVHRVM